MPGSSKTKALGSRSFIPEVRLKSDEKCSLKRHFWHAWREVIGYLSKLADLDPTGERFVYATVPKIVDGCKRMSGKKYGQRQVEYILAELRRRYVISRPLIRVRYGRPVSGFIVAPHDSLCSRSKNRCTYEGQLGGPGRWNREDSIDGPIVYWDGFPSAGAVPSAVSGAVQNSLSAVSGAVPGAVQNENKCGPECGPECGISSPQTEQDSTLSAAMDESPAESSADSLILNRNSRKNLVKSTVRTERTVEESDAENPTAHSNPASMSVSLETDLTKPKSKTVREHFADEVTLRRITDGELDEDPSDKYGVVLGYAVEVIEESAGQTYLGRKTNGDLMAKAVVLLKERRGKSAPREWYAIAKHLRQSGGPSVLAPVEVSTAHVRLFNPEAILSESCFGFYDEQLRPFETRLVEHAKANGVPRTFREALPWFETFVAASALESDSAIGGVLIALRGRNTC